MAWAPVKILLTGPPGCGKTTVLERVAVALSGKLRVAGFLTRELRQEGRRVGFQIEGFRGTRALLAHVDIASPIRVGKYGVDLKALEDAVRRELIAGNIGVDVFLIDEIGKMECASNLFMHSIELLLRDPRPLVATIAAEGPEFVHKVKHWPGIELQVVNASNRDDLPGWLASRLLVHFGASKRR